ncbi:MAG: hypothetical protein ING65_18460 [Rhodocyclaceae bacterium]|nr:hypothetical protein [Rhodocyclaceae bacterium]
MNYRVRDERISARAVAWACFANGMVFICVGLPLAFNLVPANANYGVRLAASFASEKNWSTLNITGGVSLMLTGVALTLLGLRSLKLLAPGATPASIQSAFIGCFLGIGAAPVLLLVEIAVAVGILR